MNSLVARVGLAPTPAGYEPAELTSSLPHLKAGYESAGLAWSQAIALRPVLPVGALTHPPYRHTTQWF